MNAEIRIAALAYQMNEIAFEHGGVEAVCKALDKTSIDDIHAAIDYIATLHGAGATTKEISTILHGMWLNATYHDRHGKELPIIEYELTYEE